MNLTFLKTMNVLIVEDDNVTATFLSEIIKDFFHSTYIAHDGHEAIEILETNTIHLLITDLNMPFFSGVELIKKIRKKEDICSKTPLPILVISGRKDAADFLSMIKYQLVDYIVKPFSLTQLFDVFDRLSQKMQALKNRLYYIDNNLIYDSSKKTLAKNEIEIPLTHLEALLLEILLENRGKLIPRSILIEKIYHDDAKDVTFRNLVMRLRKKLGKDYLINIKDLGMRLQ